MTAPEIERLLLVASAQIVVVMTAYFKLNGNSKKRAVELHKTIDLKIDEVKSMADVSIQKLNGMLTYVIHSFDRPAWIKVARVNLQGETEFRMLEMNELYASIFGVPRSNYLGKTDLEAGWSHETAREFRMHDLMVWSTGEPQTVTESIHGFPIRFRKLRLQSPDGTTKGVMGYAIDDLPEELLNRNQP